MQACESKQHHSAMGYNKMFNVHKVNLAIDKSVHEMLNVMFLYIRVCTVVTVPWVTT